MGVEVFRFNDELRANFFKFLMIWKWSGDYLSLCTSSNHLTIKSKSNNEKDFQKCPFNQVLRGVFGGYWTKTVTR
jgi:hypothetical protein